MPHAPASPLTALLAASQPREAGAALGPFDIALGVMPIRGDRDAHVALAEASDKAALARVVAELFDECNSPLFGNPHDRLAAAWGDTAPVPEAA